MALILAFETSSINCSVALHADGKLIASKETAEGYSHSENLHPFIKEVLHVADKKLKDLNAVLIGSGPGSFTGLRIGAAAAKGLCFSLDIPLMSYSSLDNLALQVAEMQMKDDIHEHLQFCALIDARRMEAYNAIYDKDLNRIVEARAVIMDSKTFEENLHKNKMIFFGDGMNKIRSLYEDHVNAEFVEGLLPTATVLSKIAEEKFNKSEFEDVAYFQPFYLKDFQATTPKKKV